MIVGSVHLFAGGSELPRSVGQLSDYYGIQQGYVLSALFTS